MDGTGWHEEQHREHISLAERHVREAVSRVARQQRLVDRLNAEGSDSSVAQELLDVMSDLLIEFRDHLARMEAEEAQGQQWVHSRPDPLRRLASTSADIGPA
ncbi:MAG TPA: hypothetical protein VF169_07465 [Albitalea sp.]|uniref:hypothetical protein n=1 Tax=Piscinibacter sp. TaxID=1903157 RepID=UPI002ED1F400